MTSLLILRHLRVENANAISGFTWGFPAISHFLGFTHHLSRQLQAKWGLSLGGCAVVSHRTQVHCKPLGSGGEQVFALTRNPLTKEGKTAPFNEEGRMHMDLSLLIECNFTAADLPVSGTFEESIRALENWICRHACGMRLAGGTVVGEPEVYWSEHISGEEFHRQCMRLLPGFALVSRYQALGEHHLERQKETEGRVELLDSLLDFITVRYQSVTPDELITAEDKKVEWIRKGKPCSGFLVPVMVGYAGISRLYAPGEISCTRDPSTPFRFAEALYSLGEWVSPHRINQLESLLWRYRYDAETEQYLCENHYTGENRAAEEFDDEELISQPNQKGV